MHNSKRIPDADRKKGYIHFDNRVTYNQVARLVEDPDFIKKHAFYPLISTSIKSTMFRTVSDSNREKCKVEKERPIAYAAHIDHRIYQYYGLLWSDRYEVALERAQLSEAIVAYRPGKHLSNVTGAAKAIEFIRSLGGDAMILTGDYSDFFSSLDHEYLKRAVRSLFDDGRLPDDHYKVLMSVIKYSCWPLEELLKIRGLDYSSEKQIRKSMRMLNKSRKHILSKTEFRENKDRCIEKHWKEEPRGIPQGLAVSGVLSNIYMLETDSAIANCLGECGGFYSRYCDDFIVVLPWDKRSCITRVANILKQVPGVTLHPEKCRLFRMVGKTVYSVVDDADYGLGKETHISYLGFDFDGRVVTLRARTTGRFFNRYYRSMRRIWRRRKAATKRQIWSIYRRFTEKGNCPKTSFGNRNFLSYVSRAQDAFPNDPIDKPFEDMFRRIRRDLLR